MGYYAFIRPVGLLTPCYRGPISKGTLYRLSRIRQGRHPKGRALLATPWRMASSDQVPNTDSVAPAVGADPSNEVAPPSPALAQAPQELAPAMNWDVEFPEGLDFIEDDEVEDLASAGGACL